MDDSNSKMEEEHGASPRDEQKKDGSADNSPRHSREHSPTRALPPTDPRRTTSRIVVSNLTPNVTAEHIREIAGNWGTVVEVFWADDEKAPSAVVEFELRTQAQDALDHMHRMVLDSTEVICSFTVDTDPKTAVPLSAYGQVSHKDSGGGRRGRRDGRRGDRKRGGEDGEDSKRRDRSPGRRRDGRDRGYDRGRGRRFDDRRHDDRRYNDRRDDRRDGYGDDRRDSWRSGGYGGGGYGGGRYDNGPRYESSSYGGPRHYGDRRGPPGGFYDRRRDDRDYDRDRSPPRRGGRYGSPEPKRYTPYSRSEAYDR